MRINFYRIGTTVFYYFDKDIEAVGDMCICDLFIPSLTPLTDNDVITYLTKTYPNCEICKVGKSRQHIDNNVYKYIINDLKVLNELVRGSVDNG
jgi:hypothetical protein